MVLAQRSTGGCPWSTRLSGTDTERDLRHEPEILVGALRQATGAVSRPAAGHAREAARIAAVVALHPLGVANRAVEAAVAWGCSDVPNRPTRPESTPVLLVHGCGANKSSWIALTAHLRRAG